MLNDRIAIRGTFVKGIIAYYYMDCWPGVFTPGPGGYGSPTGSCTFTTPGAYWLRLSPIDNSNNWDLLSVYVVATPVQKKKQGQLLSE